MFKKILLASFLASCLGGAVAADAGVEAITAKIKAKYPSTSVTGIAKGPAGMYEVQNGKEIYYVDAEAKYLIVGNIIDLETQKNLTDERRKELNRVEWKSLPLADAVKTVKGKGERQLAVFSDPDCPYCKRLEGELSKLDNVTIYTFLMPLDSLHPQARAKSEAVWCSKDRSAAWTELLLSGKTPEAKKCDNPIERTAVLASRLGVHGTPAIIFPSGSVVPGAVAADRIEAALTPSLAKAN